MYLLLICAVLWHFTVVCVDSKTIVKRNSPFLLTKRYLSFPEGSNFIATGSFIKALLVKQPLGNAVLGELDVAYSLPTYSKLKEIKQKFLQKHRREIYRNAKEASSWFGLNQSCMKSIFCELDEYDFPQNLQLTKRLLYGIALYLEKYGPQGIYKNVSCTAAFQDCGITLLPTLLNRIITN